MPLLSGQRLRVSGMLLTARCEVTRPTIGRAVGAVSLLRQKMDRMPLMAWVLAKGVETRMEYATRHVR